LTLETDLKTRILAAVDDRFGAQTEFLSDLTAFASTRGNEQEAQSFMAEALRRRGYDLDVWEIDIEEIRDLPGFSPVAEPFEKAVNVVGTHSSRTRKGRSLVLNGHMDVVPAGPPEMWDTPPFVPRVEGGWVYGRGAGDMKAGLSSNIFAVDALHACEVRPAADVFLQSVVEEECTGNGALACLQRGYRAEAALIPEPFGEALVEAQVGVLWFRVRLAGRPVHAAEAGGGANAIEAAMPLIAALHGMEARWNEDRQRHPCYAHVTHPLNLNIGRIEGGDWTSSVPAWCVFEARMGLYPGQDLQAAKAEIAATLHDAARQDPFLCDIPPEVTWHGFEAEGYALAESAAPEAERAVSVLESAHRAVTGTALDRVASTATTDARFFGLYADMPALVYGPRAEAIHGFNERVDLDSVRRVTQATALFIADWCGLENA